MRETWSPFTHLAWSHGGTYYWLPCHLTQGNKSLPQGEHNCHHSECGVYKSRKVLGARRLRWIPESRDREKHGWMEQNASLGTPAGALGLLHLRSPRRHWRLQTVTLTRAKESGRGAGLPTFLTLLTLRYVMSPSPQGQLSRELWSHSER